MRAAKALRRSLRALADADEAVDWYLEQGGPELASRFAEALLAAYRSISEHPGIGSPRWGHAIGVPDLRSWPVKGFPYLVFYVPFGDHIDIWRVLHEVRDIPAWIAQGH